MAAKPLPSPELLRQLLQYEAETGRMFWLPRDDKHFYQRPDGKYSVSKSWNTKFAGKEAFTSISAIGYKVANIFNRAMYAHRVIWALHYGSYPQHQIDHINGDILDNRISNLRDVPQRQNMQNCSVSRANKSGVTGVRWNKAASKWHSYIWVNYECLSLGYFSDFDIAVGVRKQAEKQYGFHRNHGRAAQ